MALARICCAWASSCRGYRPKAGRLRSLRWAAWRNVRIVPWRSRRRCQKTSASFDYIIAHGDVFLGPPSVQQALLESCAAICSARHRLHQLQRHGRWQRPATAAQRFGSSGPRRDLPAPTSSAAVARAERAGSGMERSLLLKEVAYSRRPHRLYLFHELPLRFQRTVRLPANSPRKLEAHGLRYVGEAGRAAPWSNSRTPGV